MMLGGYAGQILYIDLTKEEIRKEPLDLDMAKKFLGGFGLNCKLAWDLLDPDVDPYSPDNMIFMGMGPIIGTAAPVSNKNSVVSKWPSTGTISPGTSGGDFGIQVKLSGYDEVIIKGKAKRPVYIKINGDNVQICDASDLWGKDTYETTDMLWEKHGRNYAVVAMGTAGERLVNTTICLVDKVSTWGKGGLPAIMGSKNLKAFIACGNKGIAVVDPKRLIEQTRIIQERFKSYPDYQKLVELGTMDGFAGWADVHGMSMNNWTGRFPTEEAYRLYSPEYYLENIKAGRCSDPTCPVGCKDHLKIRKGEYAGTEAWVSSFYGRVVHMAARCQVGSYEKAVKAQEYFQRTGLCIHSYTALIDWAVELYERGILTKEDTDGVELKHDFETTMYLSEQADKNEGLGGILAQGYLKAIQDIGRGCEKYAIHVKGMEPLYDPRINRMSGPELNQVVNPRGAHAPQGCITLYMAKDLAAEKYRPWLEDRGVSAEARERIFPRPGYFNIARMLPYGEDWVAFTNSVGLGCLRGRVDSFMRGEDWPEIYSAVTGFETSLEELRECSKRIYNLYRALNVRLGFSRKDDVFPERWFEPLETTDRGTMVLCDYFGTPLSKEDCQNLLNDYYDERGWDTKTGIPTEKTLVKTGLEDVAKDLKDRGFIK
ncbi:MAG: aldehyde ferredoxin oxidoreductase C-terminal domain-containing protein [Desulfobacteraceae bacterium]|jgi:aldehyde:ferredoxin oxidoreductase